MKWRSFDKCPAQINSSANVSVDWSRREYFCFFSFPLIILFLLSTQKQKTRKKGTKIRGKKENMNRNALMSHFLFDDVEDNDFQMWSSQTKTEFVLPLKIRFLKKKIRVLHSKEEIIHKNILFQINKIF